MPVAIPVIELERFRRGGAAGKNAVALALDRACRETGLFAVDAHGVPPEVVAAARRAALAFFSLPASEKEGVRRPSPQAMRGWTPVGGETLSYSLGRGAPPDLNESFQIGRPSLSDNLWPHRPTELRRAWSAYFAELERLAAGLMGAFARALDLPESFFAGAYDRHISRLRARYYPALAAAPEPGQLRAGAHTDYVGLAILASDAGSFGLQARLASGRWEDVPIEPGRFVVNVGDLLARWSNDRWSSTLHRVVNPPAGAGDRLSLVFFHCPNADARIECLEPCRGRGAKYPPVLAGDWLAAKFAKAQRVRAHR